MIAASRRRRMGGSKPAALEVSVRVFIAHCVRTSLGTAELKSIPTNQTRLGQKKDFLLGADRRPEEVERSP